jgi:hypothetical protein
MGKKNFPLKSEGKIKREFKFEFYEHSLQVLAKWVEKVAECINGLRILLLIFYDLYVLEQF